MASPSRFDKDGYVTYASPRLLRFCAVVWYRSMKNDNRMPSHSIFPVVFSGEPSSLMASPPSLLKEKRERGIKPASFLACKSALHSDAYNADDTHPHSMEIFGHPVCKMCFRMLFGLESCRWMNIRSPLVMSTFNKEFQLDCIRCWREVPLMYVLRGMAYYWGSFRAEGTSLAVYEAIGRRVSFDPVLDWYILTRSVKQNSRLAATGEMFSPLVNHRITEFLQRRRNAKHSVFEADTMRCLDFFGIAYGVSERAKSSIERLGVADHGYPYVSFTVSSGNKTVMTRAMYSCILLMKKNRSNIQLRPLAPKCSPPKDARAMFSSIETSCESIRVRDAETLTWPYLE